MHLGCVGGGGETRLPNGRSNGRLAGFRAAGVQELPLGPLGPHCLSTQLLLSPSSWFSLPHPLTIQ